VAVNRGPRRTRFSCISTSLEFEKKKKNRSLFKTAVSALYYMNGRGAIIETIDHLLYRHVYRTIRPQDKRITLETTN
jgi:hypothetical protein